MASDWGLCSKRGTVEGKITAASSHIELFCGVRSSLQSWVHINRQHCNPAMWRSTVPAVKWWYMFGNTGWVLFAWVILDLSVWLLDEEFIPHSNLWGQTRLCDKQLQINRWKKETADCDKEKISAWITEAYSMCAQRYGKRPFFLQALPIRTSGIWRYKTQIGCKWNLIVCFWSPVNSCMCLLCESLCLGFFFSPLSTLPTCHLYGD